MATEPEAMQPMIQSADPGLPAVSQAAPGAVNLPCE